MKYHLLPTFLLEGFQEQQRVIAAQAEQLGRQQYETAAVEERLQRRLMELEAQLARMETLLTAGQSTAFLQSEATSN